MPIQALPSQSCTALCLLSPDIIAIDACFPANSGQRLVCSRSLPRLEAAPSIDCTLAAFPKLAALPTVDMEAPPACRAFSSLSRISQISLTKNRKKSCASCTRREMAQDWQGERQMAGCKLFLNRHSRRQGLSRHAVLRRHVSYRSGGRVNSPAASTALRRQPDYCLDGLLPCLQSTAANC